MTYENEWELKPDYKYKWDNFLDYDMKNHDIHENKNVCPEFNGEKMHEHAGLFPFYQLWLPNGKLWYAARSYDARAARSYERLCRV